MSRPEASSHSSPVPGTALAIVGLGCLFPKAAGPGYFWANVKNGVDCITEIPPSHWDPAEYFDADPKTPDMTYARRGGFLSPIDFNPLEFGISPRDIEATDTTQLLGLVAAKQALVDAGVIGSGRDGAPHPAVDRDRVSVILGVTGTLELVIPLGARLGHPKWKRAMADAGVPTAVADDAVRRIAETYVPWQENSFPGLLGNVVAGRIANRLDLGGTNCVVDAACASSLSAIHLAALELQAGRSDVVVTGGADTFNDIFMYMCFSKTPALSPTGDARPFDTSGDGTILGEGLGMIVLKRLADAERDGNTVYAVLRGIGSSSDGKGTAIYAPSAGGQKKALRTAYQVAGVSPDTIELVEAHGTGTRVGDSVEISALSEVYGEAEARSRPWCAIGSVKSQVGHTKAAAGAASLIKAALALYYKVLPPTLKVSCPVEPLLAADSPFYVNTRMRPWLPRNEHPRRAAVSAFGFGGSNFHAVLEEHRSLKPSPDWDGRVEIIAISGSQISEILAQLADFESQPGFPSWPEVARLAAASRSRFDRTAPYRLTLALEQKMDARAVLATARAHLTSQPKSTGWHTPDGVYFGAGPQPGQLAVMFPGQGSQSVGMLRELACLFPEMLESLAAADRAMGEENGRRLSDRIYPPPAFDQGRAEADELELRKTSNAQPALGAVEYGAWRVLSGRFGVIAQAFGGHSYGESVALAAAGRLTETELYRLSKVRGDLMGRSRGTDAGTMLAVAASPSALESLLAGHPGVTIANKNAPEQTVLAGAVAAIEAVRAALDSAGHRSMPLPVAAAFHSPLVADAAVPFLAELNTVAFGPSAVPVFSNTTGGAEYPEDPAEVRELLAYQLARPVEFVGQVRAMANAGVRTFLEVGPGTVLTRLISASVADIQTGDMKFEVFAIDAGGAKLSGVLSLAHALARLAARGHAVDLTAWEAGGRCHTGTTHSTGHTVTLTGANYVAPRPKQPPTPAQNGRTTDPLRPRTLFPSAPKVPAMPDSTPSATEPTSLAQALLMTQQSLTALARMQEQAAQLHRQFLESQESAQRTLQALVEQQQALLTASYGAGVNPLSMPVPGPPVVPPPPVSRSMAVEPPPVAPSRQAPPRPTPATTDPQEPGVAATLLAVVAEKTGYPVDSLNLKLSLDHDLGVDSIKRVEILSTLQERLPSAPVVKPEHLGTLHTLQDVANFLSGPKTPPVVAASIQPSVEEEEEMVRTLPITREQLLLLSRPDSPIDIPRVLLDVVSEKTGYQVESLNLEMSLDHDLGVDSIKRVEILSTLQERLPTAPVVKPEHLGTLHTLQDVADFLENKKPKAERVPPPEESIPAAGPTTHRVPLLAQLAEKNGTEKTSPSAPAVPKTQQLSNIIPVAQAEPVARPSIEPAASRSGAWPAPVLEMGRDSGVTRAPASRPVSTADSYRLPTGADRIDRSILQAVDLDPGTPRPRLQLAAGSEIWVVGEADGLTEQVVERLAQAGYHARAMGWAGPGVNRPSNTLSGLVLLAPVTSGLEFRLNRLAFDWIQQVGPKLRQTGRQGAAVLATVGRLDGAFGLNTISPDADPLSGGLAGLLKTARHEWPEVTHKAIDLDPAFTDPRGAAAAVADEVLSIGPLEVGVSANHRCTLDLARTVRRTNAQTFALGTKDVVLVTGGARGVTAEAAIHLAETFCPTLILTGRTPTPAAEPEWLAGLSGEAEMKQAIAEHAGPDSSSPRQVGEAYHKYLAQREVRATLRRIEEAGARVAYYPVNVADDRAVADMLLQVRVKFGPITALIHGAGVIADRRIEDLTGDDFDRVFSTKVDGLRNILDLLAHEPLKAIVLFSSTTSRFGRTGQLAYAAANEVLNKTAQVEARRRPECRVVSINWGPWEGGMVTPGLKRLFESEGIGLIPLVEGAAFMTQELNAAGRAVEVIAIGKQRIPASGVYPVAAGVATPPPLGSSSAGSGSGINMIPASAGALFTAELTPAFERSVELATHPILRSHVMDGKAVLPMAIHLEWLAHAALHGHPGLVFHGFNDLRITAGVQVDGSAAVALRAFAGKAVKQDKLFLVPVELRGKMKNGRDVFHSRAEIVLTAALPKAPEPDQPPTVSPAPFPADQGYRDYLFHGTDLHGIERIDGLGETGFIGTAFPAPPPAEWLTYPLRSTWVADPLVLDASFQMMILWSQVQHGNGSLPCFAGRYRQYRRQFPTESTTVVIRVTRDDGKFARADIDYLDPDGRVVARMQDYECVMEGSLNQAFKKNQLMVRE